MSGYAKNIKKARSRRRRALGDALSAAREARGRKPGDGKKMAERLRKKGQ